MKEEWTSVSDIGREFEGVLFTRDDYMTMEDSYVRIVRSFASESDVVSLAASDIEIFYSSVTEAVIYQSSVGLVDNLQPIVENLNSGTEYSGVDLEKVIRCNLREMVWCRLCSGSSFFVHFGYDYYVYIGSFHQCSRSIELAGTLGLFVEDIISPYIQ